MLVLSRHADQAIVLPTLGITFRVLAIRGGGVRLGIEAPPEVPILREELLQPALDPPAVLVTVPGPVLEY